MKGIKILKHDQIFKPVGSLHRGMQPAYQHMKDFDETKKKNFRDENGKVKIKLPNVVTNPGKPGHFSSTIGHTLNPFPEHMKEPYDRLRKF